MNGKRSTMGELIMTKRIEIANLALIPYLPFLLRSQVPDCLQTPSSLPVALVVFRARRESPPLMWYSNDLTSCFIPPQLIQYQQQVTGHLRFISSLQYPSHGVIFFIGWSPGITDSRVKTVLRAKVYPHISPSGVPGPERRICFSEVPWRPV